MWSYRSRLIFNCCSEDTDITQGSVATYLRCVGVFSESIITNFLLILTVKKSLKIGQRLMKLRCTKNVPKIVVCLWCVVCEGVEDLRPQLRSVGATSAYEGYGSLIDRTNTWLRDQTDVNVVNLQSILVQKDQSGEQ